jgi:hypothetical protein
MVDNIDIRIVPGETITAQIGVKFTDLDRKYQKNFFSDLDSIVEKINDRRPNYLINGATVSLSSGQNSNTEYRFNLGDATTSKLFHGFEEYDMYDFEITEVTLNIKNDLQPVYSLNSKSSDNTTNFNKNLQPYAYYSNGRSISGTIKYNSPMKPWLVAERLSGQSAINKGGIVINFGPFKLELPDITWTPDSTNSSMEQVQNKSVSFTVATDDLDFAPYLKPTGDF